MNCHKRNGIWMGGESGFQARDRQRAGCRASFVALVGCLLALAIAPAAQALSTDPFNPKLTVETSTTQAGAHPDLTIEMHEQIRAGCFPRGLPPFQSVCASTDLYMVQDLKKEVLHLPPGLVADANAAPYCDPYQSWDAYTKETLDWHCSNPDSIVGQAYVVGGFCLKDPDHPQVVCSQTVLSGNGELVPSATTAMGVVYNDRPRTTGPDAGEQGHLVVFLPGGSGVAWAKSDVSIKVRDSDTGVDSVADNLPDFVDRVSRPLGGGVEDHYAPPIEISDLVIKLNGSTGADKGHPLLTNPTLCDPQRVGAEFQGYANNAYELNNLADNGGVEERINGYGDGTTVPDSAPYRATGCDQVPYNPKVSINLDNTGPGQVPALTSTVTQDPGDATTKKATVTFPSTFKVNDKNKSTFCSEADLAASLHSSDKCADSSRVGTVTASSSVLPIGQTLTGNVYLGGLSGDSIKISAILHGFIDLRIDATTKLGQGNSLVTTFDNLPPVLVSRFDLTLEGGGDRGLLKTPKVCAPQTVTSTFTSHSGKTATIASPIEISGCQGPTLDATLSSKKPGAPTDLEFDVRSLGTKLKSVELIPARQLHWGIPKGKGAQAAKSTSVGKVTFTTASGELATGFKANRVRNDGVELVAVAPRSAQGTVSELSTFSANLSRTAARQPELARLKARKRGQRSVPQADLTLSGLPQNDLTGVDLTLNNKPKLFSLRNPLGCKHLLNFVALATAIDGTQFALKDQVRLKGRGCRR